MKCVHCLSCLKIVRIDYEVESLLYYYCPLCDTVFKINRAVEKDESTRNKVKENYEYRYGKGI